MQGYLHDLPMAAPSGHAAREAQRRWNAIAKPIGGLGLLEDAIVRARVAVDGQVVTVPATSAKGKLDAVLERLGAEDLRYEGRLNAASDTGIKHQCDVEP